MYPLYSGVVPSRLVLVPFFTLQVVERRTEDVEEDAYAWKNSPKPPQLGGGQSKWKCLKLKTATIETIIKIRQ